MKKIAIITLISTFIVNFNLYCFDLIEDTIEFLFDEFAKFIGWVVIIFSIIFLFKILTKKNSNNNQ